MQFLIISERELLQKITPGGIIKLPNNCNPKINAPFEQVLKDIDDHEKELVNLENNKAETFLSIHSRINKISNKDYRTVLYNYYILEKSLDTIASMIYRCWRQVCNIKTKALKEYEKILQEEE